MPGSSSTNPMPTQERSPAPTASTETGEEEVSAAGRIKGRGRHRGEDLEERSG